MSNKHSIDFVYDPANERFSIAVLDGSDDDPIICLLKKAVHQTGTQDHSNPDMQNRCLSSAKGIVFRDAYDQYSHTKITYWHILPRFAGGFLRDVDNYFNDLPVSRGGTKPQITVNGWHPGVGGKTYEPHSISYPLAGSSIDTSNANINFWRNRRMGTPSIKDDRVHVSTVGNMDRTLNHCASMTISPLTKRHCDIDSFLSHATSVSYATLGLPLDRANSIVEAINIIAKHYTTLPSRKREVSATEVKPPFFVIEVKQPSWMNPGSKAKATLQTNWETHGFVENTTPGAQFLNK